MDSERAKHAGVLGQLLTDLIKTPGPHPGIAGWTGPSMGAMSPYRPPNANAIAAQVRLRSKTAGLTDVIPHFLETLDRIKTAQGNPNTWNLWDYIKDILLGTDVGKRGIPGRFFLPRPRIGSAG